MTEQLLLASEGNVPVLITAAGGDDREACARAIHGASHASRGSFVRLDGRSLEPLPAPAHVPSGADDRGGAGSNYRLETGSGGTLYVDDITELDATAQARLLAWLEERGPCCPLSPPGPEASVRLISVASRTSTVSGRRERFQNACFTG
jgi:DNA-binding NtrC family response regulator